MDESASRLRAVYEAAGQGHIFMFYEKLQEKEQQLLLREAERYDPIELNRLLERALTAKRETEAHQEEIRPPHFVDLCPLNTLVQQQQRQEQDHEQEQKQEEADQQELLEAYRRLLPPSATCAVVSLKATPQLLREKWREIGLRLIGRLSHTTHALLGPLETPGNVSGGLQAGAYCR